MCEVSVRVAQVGLTASSNREQVETMNLGQAELKRFQELVKGVGIDLEIGERLAMDTRIK